MACPGSASITDDLAPSSVGCPPISNSLSISSVSQKLSIHLFHDHRESQDGDRPLSVLKHRPPPLAGTPKEAIKDTSPATVTAEDDEEVEEAAQDGKVSEVAAKTKHHTKQAITHIFQKAGKKMAGFRGDVSVDGAPKDVSSSTHHQTLIVSPSLERLETRSTNSSSAEMPKTRDHWSLTRLGLTEKTGTLCWKCPMMI